jgi:hypothetical protein
MVIVDGSSFVGDAGSVSGVRPGLRQDAETPTVSETAVRAWSTARRLTCPGTGVPPVAN